MIGASIVESGRRQGRFGDWTLPHGKDDELKIEGGVYRYLKGEPVSISRRKDPLVDKFAQIFRKQVDRWNMETGTLSTFDSKRHHPSYVVILDLAAEFPEYIVPLMIRELMDDPYDWVEALIEVTGADCKDVELWNADAVLEFRHDWGLRNGYGLT